MCRNCGASDECGWNADVIFDTEDDFDYDDFVASEFPGQRDSQSSAEIQLGWLRVVILVILVSLMLTFVF